MTTRPLSHGPPIRLFVHLHAFSLVLPQAGGGARVTSLLLLASLVALFFGRRVDATGMTSHPPELSRPRHRARALIERRPCPSSCKRTNAWRRAVPVALTVLRFVAFCPEQPPAPPPTIGVVEITPEMGAPECQARTVTGEGGTTNPVHPPSAPEGPDRKREHTMGICQGAHVVAEFPDATVEAIVLEVRGSEALVQQKGTQRAEWIPLSQLR